MDILWRIHQNREKQGLGGTKNAYNLYGDDEHTGDRGFRINNGMHFSMDSIVTGKVETPMQNNPFTRFHQSIEDYPEEHGNMDDAKMYEVDNFERMKPLMPKQGSTVGTTTLIPTVDTDEKLIYYDTQGESLYSNPPDPNVPVVDHGLDEEKIWAFRKTNYNQIVINNQWVKDPWGAIREHNAPWWGQKLSTPAFYTPEKFSKFMAQYAIRLDFENLKKRHAKELRAGDLAQRDRMAAEVGAFLEEADRKMLERELKDVYVTDHKAKAKKFSTLSDEEDQEYFEYIRRLEDYNKREMGTRVSRFESGRYERGSMKQRVFEPLAGARTLENGTLFLELSDKDFGDQLQEDKLRATFEKMRNLEALEGEDEAEIRAAVFDALES